MKFIVPPGGFAGHNQMTPASRAALGRVGVTSSGAKRRSTRTKTRTSARRSTRTSARRSTSGRKMKFGSPAWQKKYKVGKYRK